MIIELEPGTIFDDRYEVIELIAEGGMGSVYKARELELRRLVALKLLQPSLLVDSDYYDRFRQEGVVLSRLSHPGVVNFYRFGVFQEKIAYIVMELVDGESLRMELDRNGALASVRLAEIGIQTCAAMEAAHKEGIIHRDLKPDNIILLREADGEFVKVIDFGLARLVAGIPGQKLTQTGMLIGSVYYMSPEQCTGRTADVRSDVYSLGCVLYEAICGHPPFSAENPIGLMSLHVNETVPSISTVGSIPDARSWDSILAKAMAKDPKDRYASMAELSADLNLLRAGKFVPNSSPLPSSRRAWRLLSGGLSVWLYVLLVTAGFLALMRYCNEGRQDVLKTGQARSTRIAAVRLSPEWIYAYRLRRDKLERGTEITTLREWLRQFGNSDPAGTALAHFWICSELVGNASDITYSQSSHGFRYVVPARAACVGEARLERVEALRLLRKALDKKSMSTADRTNLLYCELVLLALDMTDSDRIKLCLATLRKSKEIEPRFSNELRSELVRIYRRSGDYAAEEKVLPDLVDTTSTPSLLMAENFLRQGHRSKAHARLAVELDDMTHDRWSQFNKRLIHYCGQLLFVDGQSDGALTACRFCNQDATDRGTKDFWLRDTRLCLDAVDHAVLEACALHALKRDTQAEQCLKRAAFVEVSQRVRMLPTAVDLGKQLGIEPTFFIKPALASDLADDDVRWLVTLADRMRTSDPGIAIKLSERAVQLMKRSLRKSIKVHLLACVVPGLSRSGNYDQARSIIDAAMSELEVEEHSERRLVLELLRVESLVDSQRLEEAGSRLAPLLKQVYADDFKFSQECIVMAVSLEARLLLVRHKDLDARRLYLELFKKYCNSNDLSVAQKLELLDSLTSLSRRFGDSTTVMTCRVARDKLKLPGLNSLIDVEFTR